jgi:hypothetical protein
MANLGVLAFFGLLLLGVFIFFGRRYLWHMWGISRSLHGATTTLRGVEHVPEGPVFPTAAVALRRLWSNFLRERRDTTRSYRGQELSTLHPADIFTEANVFRLYNRGFSVVLAGVFTAIGILGTFLGLAMGIASIDLSATGAGADPAQFMSQVNGLLSGMHTAFYTSIGGIVASLVWLFLDRGLYNAATRRLNDFHQEVQRLYPVESPDRLLHRLLEVEEGEATAIKDHLAIGERQLGALQSLSYDLATALQEPMQNALEGALAPVLGQVADQLGRLATDLGERQVQALDQMADVFHQKLTAAFGRQFTEFGEVLQQATTWQEQISAQTENLLKRLDEASVRQLEVIERTTTAADAIGTATTNLSDSATAISTIHETVAAQATALAALDEGLTTRAEALQSAIQAYHGANTDLQAALASQLEAVQGQVESLVNFWRDQDVSLADASAKLGTTVEEFQSLAETRLRATFEVFDREMARVVEHLSGTLADMREVSDGLGRQVQGLSEGFDRGTTAMKEAAAHMAELPGSAMELGRLRSALHELSPIQGTLASATTGLDALHVAIGTLNERLARVGDGGDQPSQPGLGGTA